MWAAASRLSDSPSPQAYSSERWPSMDLFAQLASSVSWPTGPGRPPSSARPRMVAAGGAPVTTSGQHQRGLRRDPPTRQCRLKHGRRPQSRCSTWHGSLGRRSSRSWTRECTLLPWSAGGPGPRVDSNIAVVREGTLEQVAGMRALVVPGVLVGVRRSRPP